MPRPTRRAAFFEPSPGLMLLSRISTLALHKVRNLVDHPANLGCVLQLDRMVQTTQTQTTHSRTVRLLGTNHAFHKRDFDFFIRHGLPHNLFDTLAALGSDLSRGVNRHQAIDRRTHDVVRIGGTDAFANHVGYAHHFKHCTHRAAGDDTGTVRSRLHQNARCAMTPHYRVLQSAISQRNLGQLAAGFVHRFLHRNRHLTRLPFAHTDTAITVTDHRQRGKPEDSTAFDDLAHPVDADHFFAHPVVATFRGLGTPALLLGHYESSLRTSGRLRGPPRPAP